VRIAAPFHGAVRAAASLLVAAMLAGCATPPSDPAERAAFEQTNDPLEPLNRKTLELNMFIDRILLKPVTKIYIAILPEEGRDALRRALDNMKEPVFIINDVLQGQLKQAGISVGRFTVNTTLGLAGFLDVAAKWGLDKQKADFGQTLFVWGLPQGPYLVAPILGPSNPRDLIGMGADAYMDPFSYLATKQDLDNIQITRFILDGIDQRARVIDVLDDLEKNSLDFYAQLRSLAQQRRAAELRRGALPEPGPDFYQDPGKSAVEPPAAAPPQPPSSEPSADASPPPPPGSSRDRSKPPTARAGAAPRPPQSPQPSPAGGVATPPQPPPSSQDPGKPPGEPPAAAPQSLQWGQPSAAGTVPAPASLSPSSRS
jgi:phospholipid-binding lipoprotein MlaA